MSNITHIHFVLYINMFMILTFPGFMILCSMQMDGLYGRLGALIKSRRKQLSLTQEELARRLGISRASLANVEIGRQRMLVHHLYGFAAALDLRPTDLLPLMDTTEPSLTELALPDDLKTTQKQQLARLVAALSESNTDRKR
jgi:transcriptional regulator with XRE-family HTH domain